MQRFADAVVRRTFRCPACGAGVVADVKWCDACGFTGARTLEMFPGDAPPMLPVFDAAGMFVPSGIAAVKSARRKLLKKFPQFRMNVWTVYLPSGTDLSVFGFWLLNACPLGVGETDADRKWTLLWLMDAASGGVALIPGYAVERFLGDRDLVWLMKRMDDHHHQMGLAKALRKVYQDCGELLDLAWQRRGSKRRTRHHS